MIYKITGNDKRYFITYVNSKEILTVIFTLFWMGLKKKKVINCIINKVILQVTNSTFYLIHAARKYKESSKACLHIIIIKLETKIKTDITARKYGQYRT